ncbi:MAG: DUF2330 domain-containing protein [Chloroflexota bacterium]
MSRLRVVGLILTVALLGLLSLSAVSACGGLFCQNVPVDQQAERIIFTVNPDSTITAYVQINYTGSSTDFSWVVPVPSVPKVDVAEIATFDELSMLTSPVFIAPLMPPCAPIPMPMAASANDAAGAGGGVQVLASGTAGPYAYNVVTSVDPNAMINWLRSNNYRITEEMEPLIKVYTDEQMDFLAMKLRPEQGVQDIQPIAMTYNGKQPMIPLRLTAVAATPNMNVITWVFGNAQALPTNYAHPAIQNDDIRGTFFTSDGTNYLQLVDQTVDLYSGRAFITEYAEPTSALKSQTIDPLLQKLFSDYGYVTRVFGRISPEEMTVDPVFKLSSDVSDVTNVHDLSKMDQKVFWGCSDVEQPPINIQYDPNVVPPDFQ